MRKLFISILLLVAVTSAYAMASAASDSRLARAGVGDDVDNPQTLTEGAGQGDVMAPSPSLDGRDTTREVDQERILNEAVAACLREAGLRVAMIPGGEARGLYVVELGAEGTAAAAGREASEACEKAHAHLEPEPADIVELDAAQLEEAARQTAMCLEQGGMDVHPADLVDAERRADIGLDAIHAGLGDCFGVESGPTIDVRELTFE